MSKMRKAVSLEISVEDVSIPVRDLRWFAENLKDAKEHALAEIKWNHDGSVTISADGGVGD